MASWKKFADESGIYTLPPKERDEAFGKWENDVLEAQTRSGAFDNPGKVDQVAHYIEQKRGEITRDVMDPPTPEDTAKAVQSRYSAFDAMQPEPKAFRDASDEVSSGRAPAKFVGGRILVGPQALRDPKAYREAILSTDAPPLVKARYASQREGMFKEGTKSRRNELAGELKPHALEIVEELQDAQEYLGADMKTAKDLESDFALKKDADGNWTVPKPAGFSLGRLVKGLFTSGTSEADHDVNRVPVKALSDYQKKHDLTDEEMQTDYVEALKRDAPSSVSRWFGRKTDLESLSPEIGSKTRVINKDIGAPEVITPDNDLVFKKPEYDAAVDATPGVDDATKQQAKDRRQVTAELLAPQMFNALRNNRSDFENYAKSADSVKGTDAPKAMVKAVEDYYKDKKDQSWVQDMGEFAGQQGSALQEGFYRTSAMPYALAGFMGNKKAAGLAADLARGLDSQASADTMVGGNIGAPGTTQFARDFTNIVPDLAVQVAMSIPTGGLTAASAVGRITAAAGVEANVARQALQIATRAGTAEKAAAAMKAAGLADNLVAPAMDAAKFLTSKNLIKGGAGRQIALQSGYAGISQMSSSYAQIMNTMMDEGASFEEAQKNARLPAAVAGAITATVTGLFSAAGHGGVEKPFSPGDYTVRDLVRTGLWRDLKDPASREIVKKTTKTLLGDASDEAIEEGLDQFLQGVASYAVNPTKEAQEKRIGEVISESVYAAGLGAVGGLTANAAHQFQSSNALSGDMIKKAELLRAVARGDAPVESLTGLARVQDTDVDADALASSLGEEADKQANETAANLAANPDTAQTGEALAALTDEPVEEVVPPEPVPEDAAAERASVRKSKADRNQLEQEFLDTHGLPPPPGDTSEAAQKWQQARAELNTKLEASRNPQAATPVVDSTPEAVTPEPTGDSAPVSTSPTAETPEGSGAAPVSPIEDAMKSFGEGALAATADRVSAGKDVTIRNPEAVAKLKTSPVHKFTENADGSLTVTAVLDPRTKEWVGKTAEESTAGKTSEEILSAMDTAENGESTAGKLGISTVYHASREANLAPDVANARKTRQGEGKAGFYMAPQESELEQYKRNGSEHVYSAQLPPDTRVKVLPNGKIERLTPEQIADLKSQGYGAVVGKVMLGRRVEVVPLSDVNLKKVSGPSETTTTQAVTETAPAVPAAPQTNEKVQTQSEQTAPVEAGSTEVSQPGSVEETPATPPADTPAKENVAKTAPPETKAKEAKPASAKPTTKPKPAEKPKAKSAMAIPEALAGTSKANQDAREEVDSLTKDFLEALKGVFSGVEMVDTVTDDKTGKTIKTGGWYYNKLTGKLGIVLTDVARELNRVRNKKKWVLAAVAEEAIHSVAVKLERQGKLNSKGLLRDLKRESPRMYDKVKAIYQSATSEQAIADEFLRMLVQGRLKFSAGGVKIDGELTEMQFSSKIIAAIKKVMNQLLNIVRDLKKSSLPAEFAAELDEVASMIEDNLRSLVEQENRQRPPDEDFTWQSEDPSLSQSSDSFQTGFTKLAKKQADGEGGFLDAYNVVGGPAAGTTFMVPEGSSDKVVQAAADAKTVQFSDKAFSQSPDSQRAQEMGVPGLGEERVNESRKAIQQAVRDEVFDASKAEVDNPDDYQDAHDLITSLTQGDVGEALKKLKAKVKDHPELDQLPKALDALAAVAYGEAIRYAIRQITDGTNGRTADFSLFKTALDNYHNLPKGAAALLAGTDDPDASATARIARIMASLQEASEPMGLYLKWHAANAETAEAAMLKAGFGTEEIKAIGDAATRPTDSKEYKQAVDDTLDARDAELKRLNQIIEDLHNKASVKEPEGSLTEKELALLPKDIQEAYRAMLTGRVGGLLNERQLADVESTLFNAREQMEESGIKALGDAFFVGLQKPKGETLLGGKSNLVNSQMGAILRETLAKLGVVSPKRATDPGKVYEDIARALGSDELRLAKVPLIEEAIQKRIMEETKAKTFEQALATEWGREMWTQWQSVADALNSTTKVSGGILTRAIRTQLKVDKATLGDLKTKEDRSKLVDSVLAKVQEVSSRAPSNIQEGMWPKVREEIEARLNGMIAQAEEAKSRKKVQEDSLPVDADALIEAEAKKISAKFATETTPGEFDKEKDVNLSLRKLAQMHLQEPRSDFVEVAMNMGLSEDSANQLEKAISETRVAKETVAAYRQETRKKKAEEKAVEKTIEDRALKLMQKHATQDTWTADKKKTAEGDLETLVKKHAKEKVPDFVKQAVALGLNEETATLLEKQVSTTRGSANEIRKLRKENAQSKAKDRAVKSLMRRHASPSNKPSAIKDIVQAMMKEPDFVSNPAWRKQVVADWLDQIGIEIPRIKLDQLDILIANVFADAQAKLLREFNATKKGRKIQPTEMERLVKAIKVGMVTGAPVQWQTAFLEKQGIKGLTPEQMRDILHHASVVDNASGKYNLQDQVVANGQIAEIFRKSGAPPGFLEMMASSYVQSALTGIGTQSLQFLSGLFNVGARIFEDTVTGKGITPVVNGIRSAYEAGVTALKAALINDNYRESTLDQIAKLSALKTLLENKIEAFKNAKGIAKAKHLPALVVGLQDLFRRLMSSADDAAVASLKSYVNTVATQGELRKLGINQDKINQMFEVAKAQMATLDTDAMWKQNRPNMSRSNYQQWALDEATDELRKSMQQAMAERLVAQNSDKNAKDIFDEINSYALREAEADVGVGKLRDKIVLKGMSQKEAVFNFLSDPLQFLGEFIVGDILEKHLRLKPKDPDPSAPIKNMIARMLFGFLRTPLNVMSRSVYRGPLGLWRLLVSGAIMPGKFSERAAQMYSRTMADARQQAQRRTEGLVWTLTMAALYGLAKGLGKDDDENDPLLINGQGPSGEKAKEAWRAAGHQANSIELNMGDTKISIPFGRSGLEGIKPGLMMLGTMNDMHLNGMAKGEPETLWQYAKSYGNNTIYNASLFGFRNVANWRQDTSGENAFVKRAAYAFSPLVPFSGFTKSIGKLVRPGKPDDKTLAGALAISTPVFWIGEDAKNLYGQDVYGTPSSTTGDVTRRLLYGVGLPFSVDVQQDKKAAEVYEFSLKTGRAPSNPSREEIDTRFLRRDKDHLPMTDKQWLDYQMAAGKERFASMKEFVPHSKDMSDQAIERNLNVVNRRAENAGKRAVSGK